MTHFLNTMRYHDAYINNIFLPPTSINSEPINKNIYYHFRVSLIDQNLMLILTHTQYSLRVKNLYNIVAWQIMKIDSLMTQVLFNVHHIHQCIYHEKTISMTKTSHHLKQKVMQYSLRWITHIHEPIVDYLSFCKEPMTWIFCVTPNAPKSYIMQVMWACVLK